MFSNSAEKTLTLTMGDLSLQTPRTLFPPSPPPVVEQPTNGAAAAQQEESTPAFPEGGGGEDNLLRRGSLSPPTSAGNELVDFSNSDFYPSTFDNSFPIRGILNNERTISSPTSNTSFLSETSFNGQSLFNSNQDRIFRNDSGLLIPNTSAYRDSSRPDLCNLNFVGVNNSGGGSGDLNRERNVLLSPINYPSGNGVMNDSGLGFSYFGSRSQSWDTSPKTSTSSPSTTQLEFSFSVSDTSFNNGGGSSNGSDNSNASADSPTRQNPNLLMPNYGGQWHSSDISPLLDNSSSESTISSSSITPTSLGNSIWSPSQTTPPTFTLNAGANASGGEEPWDVSLDGYSKEQLMAFVDLLMQKQEECARIGDSVNSDRLQSAIVRVQKYIITSFVSSGHPFQNVSPIKRTISPLLPPSGDSNLERMAQMHRDFAGNKETNHTWSGHLPTRIYRAPVTYSCKVFLGGLPFDINEATLMDAFKRFGIVKIEWPGKDNNSQKIKGYAYAVFENERQVKMLLQSCTHDYRHSSAGNYYYKLSSKRFRCKDVQIIPWALSDSNFVRSQPQRIDPLRTIFVGALHGMINAEGLATIMNDLFGGVVYAGVDTDRNKYPIGSARVTFNNTKSYMKAVLAAFVLIKTSRFVKKVQIDPYLDDATCSVCNMHKGPYFCRDVACFNYYCRTCFHEKHSEGSFLTHIPMMKTANCKQDNKDGNGSRSSSSMNGRQNGSGGSQVIRNAYFHNFSNGNGANPFGGGNGNNGNNGGYFRQDKTGFNPRSNGFWNNVNGGSNGNSGRNPQWSTSTMDEPSNNCSSAAQGNLGSNNPLNGGSFGAGGKINGAQGSLWNNNGEFVGGSQTFTNKNFGQPGFRPQQNNMRW